MADGLETWVNESDVDGFNFVSIETLVHNSREENSLMLLCRPMSSSRIHSRISLSSSYPSSRLVACSGMATASKGAPIGRTSTARQDRRCL